MKRESLLKLAREYEQKAYRLESSKQKRYGEFKDVSDAYKKTGEAYERAGDLMKAIDNFKDARKFAPEEDREEIGEKLTELKHQKKRMLSSLERARSGLEKKFIFPILAIATLVIALFFVSFNLTGYAIGGLTQNNSTLLGISLFILGMVFAFFYFKGK